MSLRPSRHVNLRDGAEIEIRGVVHSFQQRRYFPSHTPTAFSHEGLLLRYREPLRLLLAFEAQKYAESLVIARREYQKAAGIPAECHLPVLQLQEVVDGKNRDLRPERAQKHLVRAEDESTHIGAQTISANHQIVRFGPAALESDIHGIAALLQPSD